MSTLYMMVGIPASGKSTFAKTLKGKYISRDVIRFSLIKDGDAYFSKENEVFAKFIYEIKTGLAAGQDVIVDATHINAGSRHKLLSKIYSDRTVAIVMDTTFETCLERNAKREGRACVPKDAMYSMYNNFTIPNYDEGFDAIIIVKGDAYNE